MITDSGASPGQAAAGGAPRDSRGAARPWPVFGLEVGLGPTHVSLPAHLISARQAENIVRKQQEKGRADTTGLRIHAGPLTTERAKGDTGPWRAIRSVVVTDDTPCASAADGIDCEPTTVKLDARTGADVG
ncbi:hypothetical protein [Streptomyces sp. NPDC046759]|uniref:hypothetical protein n=1 Tax=Streptomyces sp. NPDC046759 TaxID=3155019 RepID=UPI00341187AC